MLAFSILDSHVLTETVEPYYDYDKVLPEVNPQAIMEHIVYLSSLRTRVTGYSGSYEAANYIANKFEEFGLQPISGSSYFQEYTVTVPIDHGTCVKILPNGPVIEAYALWPNSVQTCFTPPEGIEGTLIYAGEGTLRELSEAVQRFNKSLEECIVLMEFNSMDNWVKAASFGAKAIIFIEPKPDTNRLEAQSKFLKTPIKVPRLYVTWKDGLFLKELAKFPVRIRIELNMKYENVAAWNVIGIIKGSAFPNDVIIFSSYYDSWSIVPKLAPGADEASGVAVLLELAKFFSKHKPRRTLWFVAFSGHWQALAGSREFVEKYYFSEDVLTGKTKLWALLNFYLSTESPTLTYINYGLGYGYSNTRHIVSLLSIIEKSREPLKSLGFAWDDYVETPRWDMGLHMDSYFIHEAETVAVARAASLSYVTTRTLRFYWGTPFDIAEKVQLQNLSPQAALIFCTTYTIANIESLGLSWDAVSPQRYFVEAGYGLPSGGFAKVEGDVVRFNPQTRWYTFEGLEGYDILVSISYRPGVSAAYYNPFMTYIIKASPNGTFIVNGIGADAAFGGAWIRAQTHIVNAFLINRTTGDIEWFTDSGIWGWSNSFGLDRPVKFVRVSVFKCASATLYGIEDPNRLWSYTLDPNWYGEGFPGNRLYFLPNLDFVINDFKTHAPPVSWGIIAPISTGEPLAMVFLPDKTIFEVMVLDAASKAPVTVLVNASEQHPEGAGFTIEKGGDLRINVPLQASRDMYFLNMERYKLAKSYDLYTPLGELSLKKSAEYFRKVFNGLQRMDYEEAYSAALAIWTWQSIGYLECKTLIQDVTYASLTFGVLLVPFMFLAERLFLSWNGKRRIAGLIITFLIPYLAFYIIHPGSRIALSAPLAILSYAVLFFIAFIFLSILGNLSDLMREVRKKIIGLHFAEISRTGALLSAISTGIEEMKKRKLRSFLTMLTIVLMVFSLVSFTSIYGVISTVPREQPPLPYKPYQGMLIQSRAGLDPIGEDVRTLIQYLVGPGSLIAYRAWVYPSFTPSPESVRPTFMVRTPEGKSYEVWAMLGLTPEEIQFNPGVLAGLEGRWFTKEDLSVCIVSKKFSEKMGIKVGDEIVYSGLRLIVVGIIDDEIFNIVLDLNGYSLSPIDFWVFHMAIALQLPLEAVREFASERLPVDRIIIIPFKLAQTMGGMVYSIVVKTEDFEYATKVAQELIMMMNAPLTVYVSSGEKIYLYSRMTWFSLIGFTSFTVLYAIAAFSVLMTMLNAVYERTREIRVFSAVGLTPSHVMIIFLIQSLLYGIVGGIMGYLVGVAGLHILVTLKFFPPEFIPNFAASSALLPIELTVLICILSTLYPALKASRLVTPSLERKWKLTTKPIGDEWYITIPFRASETEVLGIMEFMREYMESQSAETMGPFITLAPPIIRSETGLKIMETKVHLAPFDANVTQNFRLIAKQLPGEALPLFEFHLHLRLLTGNRETWIRSNRSFIDRIRKQLLIWRGLRDVDKRRYIERKEGS
jgi:ABC-type antimicrobial peptide transport system permease subunit